MKKLLGILTCVLLGGCEVTEKIVIKGPSPGIEYRNQNTYPWPWISVVPSERALAFSEVDFDALSRHFHYDMSFYPHHPAFEDVRIVLLDYTILPDKTHGEAKIRSDSDKHPILRSPRYFMVASFYKIGNCPPNPPDFEVTASMDVRRAAPHEAMRLLARNIIEDIHSACDSDLLNGLNIVVNMD